MTFHAGTIPIAVFVIIAALVIARFALYVHDQSRGALMGETLTDAIVVVLHLRSPFYAYDIFLDLTAHRGMTTDLIDVYTALDRLIVDGVVRRELVLDTSGPRGRQRSLYYLDGIGRRARKGAQTRPRPSPSLGAKGQPEGALIGGESAVGRNDSCR